LAALCAEPDGAPDDETLDFMFQQVEVGELIDTPPSAMWPELVKGLMAPAPATMIQTLRDCGALAEILPEVASLFGVPQIADDSADVDIGLHLLNTLAEAARRNAPLAVRYAVLVMHVGKSDSPPEHLPVHYRHIERALPRVEAISERFGVPDDCRDLALLAAAEYERVSRASEVRAGPIAAMLERVGAFDQPERFQQLMLLCTCDYCAYDEDRAGTEYAKVGLLCKAVAACDELDEEAIVEDLSAAEAVDAMSTARAQMIAEAFQSVRWS
jgi:tRNA nucleotidyltransferase (CCA-adding enzyme)